MQAIMDAHKHASLRAFTYACSSIKRAYKYAAYLHAKVDDIDKFMGL
jgi:hypothetical protein